MSKSSKLACTFLAIDLKFLNFAGMLAQICEKDRLRLSRYSKTFLSLFQKILFGVSSCSAMFLRSCGVILVKISCRCCCQNTSNFGSICVIRVRS